MGAFCCHESRNPTEEPSWKDSLFYKITERKPDEKPDERKPENTEDADCTENTKLLRRPTLKDAVKKIIIANSLSDYYFVPKEKIDLSEVTSQGNLDSQTGGHAGAFIKLDNGTLAKIGDKNELLFYPDLSKHWPREFIPMYHGEHIRDENVYIVLEDLTIGFSQPCILDVKMGTQTYENQASFSKKAKLGLVDVLSTTNTDGARVVGMKVWEPQTSSFKCYGKSWGALTVISIKEAFRMYLSPQGKFRSDVCAAYIKKVDHLYNHFRVQYKYKFVGSSLLFLYDGNGTKTDVRMIDFAHSKPSADGTRDEGYIRGLTSILEALRELAQEAK